jgi:type I restriction enzyme S subunit
VTGLVPYPAYRESDVPWVDRIPAEWLTAPLYSLLRGSRSANVGMRENNLLSLSYGRIVRRDIKGSKGLLPESFETYQVVEPGDVVFRLTDLQNDKRSLRSALVGERGIITSAYLAATPRGINPEYAAYLMRAYDTSKVFYGLGGGVRQSLKFDDVRRLPLLVPPAAEQVAITCYLDRETAQIDALIGKQEQLIDTLRERRTAVVDAVFIHLRRRCRRRRSVRPGGRPHHA